MKIRINEDVVIDVFGKSCTLKQGTVVPVRKSSVDWKTGETVYITLIGSFPALTSNFEVIE